MMDDRFAAGKRNILGDSPRIKVESGTCNVCSAPCSSCLHRTLSRVEYESSGKGRGRAEADSCSFITAEGQPSFKEREYYESVTSSHASYSEHAESKVTVKMPNIGDSSEVVNMPSKVPLPLGGSVTKDQHLPGKIFDSTLLSTSCHSKYDFRCKSNLKQEPQHREECHGDNIAFISEISVSHDLCTDMSKKAWPSDFASTGELQRTKASQDSVVRGSEAKQNSTGNLDTCSEQSPRKKRSDASDQYVGLPDKSGTKDFLKAKSMNLSSRSGSSQQHAAEDLQRNQVYEPCGNLIDSGCVVDNVKCSSKGRLAFDTVNGDIPANNEENNASEIRDESSPCDSKNELSCSKNDPEVVTNNINKQDEKRHYLCNAAGESELQNQAKAIYNDGNFESDSGLVDVKVCDICGDAGREALLATCSKCSDGAEHTYCMRVMLDKVPEGEWLCEECQLRETEDKIPSSPRASCVQRAEDMNTLNHNKLHAMVTDTEMGQLTPGLQSPRKPCEKREGSISYTTNRRVCEVSTAPSEMTEGLQSPKKTGEKHVGSILPPSSKRVSESGTAPSEMASPRKYGFSPRESSFKNSATGNMKLLGNASSSSGQGQAIKSSQSLSRSYSFGGTSKIQEQLTSPRGLSKQCSFNSSNMKHSVQRLTDIIPGKNMMARHSASRNAIHDGAVRKLIKSASFKSMSSGHSNVSFVNQKQFPKSEELKSLKAIKEKSVLEKKSSLTVELPSRSPSPKVDTSMKKVVSKAAQCDENLFSKSASSPLTTNRGSVCGEKKPNFPTYKSHERCSFKDQKPCGIVPMNHGCVIANESNVPSGEPDVLSQNRLPRPVESVLNDSEAKEPINASNSRQATCDSKKIELSQKSNQGQALQTCPVSKVHASTNKPSASRSLKESCDKTKTWKNPVGAATPGARMQQINGMLDKSDLSSEIISEDLVPRPDYREKLPLKEIPEDKDILRSSYGDSYKSEATMGLQYDKRLRDFNLNTPLTGSDELGAEPVTENFHGPSSLLGTSLRSFAIPEHEFIWQGSFEVSRAGNLPELFDGIQAHLSTCVSPNVPEILSQFSCRIKLEEVPRLNSWPVQFQEKTPSEDNIALFFFAKDIESYERTYTKLLENMLRNDLALKGVLSGVELLIFPSDKLSENCQRWNNLLFLWGVFRARKSECSREPPDAQRELCVPTLSTDSNPEGLSFPHVFASEGLSSGVGSPNLKAQKTGTFLDSKSFLPYTTLMGCVPKADELPSESPWQATAETWPSKLVSCFLPVTWPSKRMSRLHSSLDSPSSELQTSLEESPLSFNNRASGLNNGNRAEDCRASISQIYSHKISTPDHPSTMLTSPNLREDEFAEKERAIKSEVSFLCESEEQPKAEDRLCSDSRPRKRLLHSSNSIDDRAMRDITTNFFPLDDEPECKKRKYWNEDLDSFSISRHPSIVIDISQQHTSGDVYSSRSPRRRLDDDGAICVLSSDDDDLPESRTPDLELALGKKSSNEAKVLPVLLPSINRRAMQDQADPPTSLSLSLGFPGAVTDSDRKTKRFLPEGPDIDTWSLFGGFTGP